MLQHKKRKQRDSISFMKVGEDSWEDIFEQLCILWVAYSQIVIPLCVEDLF